MHTDKELLDLYNSGLTIREMGKELDIPFSTLARRLRAIPEYKPRPSGVEHRSELEEDWERVTFHLEVSLIEKIKSLPEYESQAEFYREAVKEKLNKLP